MKTLKLSLDDFEGVSTDELLEIRGGSRPHVFHSRNAILAEGPGGGGGGGINNCPKCKEAYQQDGTPIPRRCNGSSHFSGSIAEAWNNFWNGGNTYVGGYRTIISTGIGCANDPYQQFKDYYENYDPNGSSLGSLSAPSRAQVIKAMNSCQ